MMLFDAEVMKKHVHVMQQHSSSLKRAILNIFFLLLFSIKIKIE
jgi:hypothetical protein